MMGTRLKVAGKLDLLESLHRLKAAESTGD